MKKWMKKYLVLLVIVCMVLQIPVFGESFSVYNRADDVDLSLLKLMINTVQDEYVEKVDINDLIEGAYRGMFDALDRHSVYLTQEELIKFNESLDDDFSGIGVHITKEGDYLGVISSIEGTPAYDAGLKTGDIIISVDGQNIKGWSLEKAVSKIRGQKGTPVTIGVIRSGVATEMSFKIVRDVIDIKYVSYEMTDDSIGYMKIESFGEGVGSEVGEGLSFFMKKKAKGIILDLRGNPGGNLWEAISVSDYFLNEGDSIVYIDKRVDNDTEHFAKSKGIDLPLVVLIDGGSASASEIVTAAIQDNKAGTVVGTTSYGKGTVQQIRPLVNGAGMKITIAEYLSPLKNKINDIGVTPDVVVENVKKDVDYSSFAPMIEGGVFKVGSKGLDVYGAQQRLKFLGYKISADGLFGKNMEMALKTFQSKEGLEANGFLDLKTKQRIKERVKDYIVTGKSDAQLEEAKTILLKSIKK